MNLIPEMVLYGKWGIVGPFLQSFPFSRSFSLSPCFIRLLAISQIYISITFTFIPYISFHITPYHFYTYTRWIQNKSGQDFPIPTDEPEVAITTYLHSIRSSTRAISFHFLQAFILFCYFASPFFLLSIYYINSDSCIDPILFKWTAACDEVVSQFRSDRGRELNFRKPFYSYVVFCLTLIFLLLLFFNCPDFILFIYSLS